ncbi:MAG: molybdenum cofactor guanylyltransferase [Verrucomicrobiota bacterium]
MEFSALLLAGGSSKRMGKDKALILDPFGDPLWKRQWKLLTRLDPHTVFIAARDKPEWLPETSVWVQDANEASGPIAGIVAALRACETSHLICSGLDLVNMTPTFLKTQMDQCGSDKGIVVKGDRGWEPLSAILPLQVLPLFEKTINQGTFKLQDVLDTAEQQEWIRSFSVTAKDAPLFRNLNTLSDIEQWKNEVSE